MGPRFQIPLANHNQRTICPKTTWRTRDEGDCLVTEVLWRSVYWSLHETSSSQRDDDHHAGDDSDNDKENEDHDEGLWLFEAIPQRHTMVQREGLGPITFLTAFNSSGLSAFKWSPLSSGRPCFSCNEFTLTFRSDRRMLISLSNWTWSGTERKSQSWSGLSYNWSGHCLCLGWNEA